MNDNKPIGRHGYAGEDYSGSAANDLEQYNMVDGQALGYDGREYPRSNQHFIPSPCSSSLVPLPKGEKTLPIGMLKTLPIGMFMCHGMLSPTAYHQRKRGF